LSKKKTPLLKIVLFGIIIKDRKETTLFVDSLVNPGPDYVIGPDDRAYLMVLEKGEFQSLAQEKLDAAYREQVTEHLKRSEVRQVDLDQLYQQVTEMQHRTEKQEMDT